MSSTDTGLHVPGAPPERPGDPPPPLVEAQHPHWLERLQRARPRHAAITRNLQTWSNYKSWAEQMRDAWEPGSVEEPPAAKK